MQFENRLKKLERELPEKVRSREQQNTPGEKVSTLQFIHVYQPMWIREQSGIRNPWCEAIDRYFLKKRKEREENDERRRSAHTQDKRQELESANSEPAVREATSPVTSVVTKTLEAKEDPRAEPTAPKPVLAPRTMPRPSARRTNPAVAAAPWPRKGQPLSSITVGPQRFKRRRW
jgi:hypothetical protein